MPDLIGSAWILCEDPECRATVAVTVGSAGYHDVVAFEDAQQLLAHRPTRPPALVVVDSWTGRFDAKEIYRVLAGVPIVALVAIDEHDEPWRSLGVTLLLRKPPSTRVPVVHGFATNEGPSGTRAVPSELRAGHTEVEDDDGATERETHDREPRPTRRSAKPLEDLLACIGRSIR